MKKSIITLLIIIGLGSVAYASECTRNTNETVSCSKSGLMWQDNSDVITSKKTWQDAISYCESLTLAGYNDWRLPNLNELRSIVDYEKPSGVGVKIKDGFENISSSRYLTSSTVVSSSSNAWAIYFFNGFDDWEKKSSSRHFRCVRIY